MPFKSKAQQRFMYSQHPRLAKKFQAETPKNEKLPVRKVKRPSINKRLLKKVFPRTIRKASFGSMENSGKPI